MDSWPEQLATAIAQIQQKQILQTAGLRTTGLPTGRLGTARNSIAIGRSTADETLINKMAQVATQGLTQPNLSFHHQMINEQPCCAARKQSTSICPTDLQQLASSHALHHQLHAFQPIQLTAEQQMNVNQLQQQQQPTTSTLLQQSATGRSFERQPNYYLHPNDAASLAANRPSWSAGNLTNANVATNQSNPNANKNNRELLALFVPRAGSLDA